MQIPNKNYLIGGLCCLFAAGAFMAYKSVAMKDGPVSFLTQSIAPEGRNQDSIKDMKVEIDKVAMDLEIQEQEWLKKNPPIQGGGPQEPGPIDPNNPVDREFKCEKVTDIPMIECLALLDFYISTKGSQWTDNTNWLKKNTACSWKGVSCNNGHVVGLILDENNINGKIPSTLGNLSELEVLSLYNNAVIGQIPSSLGKLYRLKKLLLYFSAVQLV